MVNLYAVVVACVVIGRACADFTFPDFASVDGLVFNGDATTTTCDGAGGARTATAYAVAHGNNDGNPEDGVAVVASAVGTSGLGFTTTDTSVSADSNRTCAGRVR